MSVKHAILALLSSEPSSTYQLCKRFDASTGQSWPLNIGQASSTLQRLERDGLVVRDDTETDGESGGQPWRLTSKGADDLQVWWERPVVAEQRGRGELVVKLALATVTPGVDVLALVQRQRSTTQRTLHDLTRLRRQADDFVGQLVLDHHLFLTEAELRWLDHIEGTLGRRAEVRSDADAAITAEPSPVSNAKGRR
ncbi:MULTISPECIES: PadR family transcriptional regulator [unclassified Brevibacterium]|uniref:PadR family transcriptional regulator n=1 Tax=unclassified Brevibacterium TaxID=2614124 RepID=UPI0008A388D9|nr:MULTISPECIES: PadR family transcriptional regulator [unclassified Brevibacterium]OFL68862.1 hypothetical protein HMPREF2757_06615 [Brevibacterium sp. HMSC063G07]OFS26879.1 hypothetical protein HMPREF3162_04215 [Brevibacterium sp. HMSC07C04]